MDHQEYLAWLSEIDDLSRSSGLQRFGSWLVSRRWKP